MVIFIDILGCANHVAEAAKNGNPDKAKQIDAALRDIKRLDESSSSETHIFSDSAIISVGNDGGAIQEVFENLSILTWSLMTKGVWIRGGVSYGQVSDTRNKPWGPAIIDAYNFESGIARYPRIAFASSALTFLRKKHLIEKIASISRDQDGVYSLNSVEKGFELFSSDKKKTEIGLKFPKVTDASRIKDQLDTAFEGAVDSPDIFKKIAWLCRQWDHSAAQFEKTSEQDFRTKYFDDYTAKDVFGNGLSVLRELP